MSKATLSRKILLPIQNSGAPLFEISPWFIHEGINADQISDEDYATLHRADEGGYTETVGVKSLCVVSQLTDGIDPELAAQELAAKIQYVFKSFATAVPVFSQAAVIVSENGKKAYVERPLLLPVLGDYSDHLEAPFTFSTGTSATQVSELYKIIELAAKKSPSFMITLSRYNSSVLRSTPHDRIIDIAISLESLMTSTTEIAFKFALFTAFITRQKPADREQVFELLQTLYGARSAIVHGDVRGTSAKKKIEAVTKQFDHVLAVANAAISYHALFLFTNKAEDWPAHVEKLVLGTEQHIGINAEKNNENIVETKN